MIPIPSEVILIWYLPDLDPMFSIGNPQDNKKSDNLYNFATIPRPFRCNMEDLLKMALRLSSSSGAKYSEARHQSDTGFSFFVKNGLLEVSRSYRSEGLSIRVIVDGALGFSSTNELSRPSVRRAAERAVSSAKATSSLAKPPVQLSSEDLSKSKFIIKPRIRFENVELDQAVELIRDSDKAAIEIAGKRSVKMVSRFLTIFSGVTEKTVINSDGAEISSSVPRTAFNYMLIGSHPQKGTAMRSSQFGESGGWEVIEKGDVMQVMEKEGESMAKVLDLGKPSPMEKIDVLLGGEVVALICHESSGHPGEADRILGREAAQAGESYLSINSVGMEVGSPLVNVVDDPTLRNSYGFYLYDEEGVKARKRYLIKEGRITEFLQNRETAAVTGMKSNGASRASSYNREPIVRMANTYMEAGDRSFQELIEDIKKGVYVRNFTEWNIDDRRFNQRYVGFEAFLVENGEITDPVRNPAIEMTTVGLYKAVDAVGEDLRFWSATCGKGDPSQGIPVWTGGPTIRLRDVRLGGAF